MLFQDLCQLVNADAPYWLVGMTEMTRTFGLELLESVLNDFPGVFLQVNTTLDDKQDDSCSPSEPLPCFFIVAPGVQFPVEGTRLSAGHQALLSKHQVPSGQQQQQRGVSGPRGETLFPHLYETPAGRLSSHQTLLQPPGETQTRRR